MAPDFYIMFVVLLLILVSFWLILALFKGPGEIKKSKMADSRWPPFRNKTQFLRYIAISAHVIDLIGKRTGRTICPLSFVVKALIFYELRWGADSSRWVPRPKGTRSEYRVKKFQHVAPDKFEMYAGLVGP